MKRLLATSLWMFIFCFAYAQAPQAVCYQAVATDASGIELQARNISVRTTLLQGTINGNVVREEIHNITTDDFGLFDLQIGQGQATPGSPDFSAINWGEGPFFLKTEMDQNGGADFVLLGISQILSVPYALYGERAGTAETALFADSTAVAATALTALDDNDTSSENELQDLEYNTDTGVLSLSGSDAPGITLNTNDADSNPTNELQTLQYNPANNELNLSDSPGSAITLNVDDADSNPTNELQTLQYNPSNNELSLSDSPSGPVSINIDDADSNPTNEIQQLTFENNVLSISGSNSVNFTESKYGAPGASSDFPQGIVGEHVVLATGEFTVPAGKTFYLTAGGNKVDFMTGDGAMISHPNTPNMPVFGPGTVMQNCMCTGVLVDYNDDIQPAVMNLTSASALYTVPDGFILFIKSGISNAMTGSLKINGLDMEFLRPNFTRGSRILSFPAGTQVQRPTNSEPGPYVLTGYLIALD